MNEKTFERILFETIIVLAIGLLGFTGLSVYNMRVIDQQQKLIQQMGTNPACMGKL
jgi:hypothetical protein